MSPSSDSENLQLLEQRRFVMSPEDNMNRLDYQSKRGPKIEIENYDQYQFKGNIESDPKSPTWMDNSSYPNNDKNQ